MENKILIYFGSKGYNLMLEDGTPMEFIDGSPTTNIPTLKAAISICVDHEYAYEII